MPHSINAFIGKSINHFAESWSTLPIYLPQGFSIIFLTESLFDAITSSVKIKDTQKMEGFAYLSPAIIFLLEKYSQDGRLAYIETNYHGGTGTQSAIVFEKGRQILSGTTEHNYGIKNKPIEEWAINRALKTLGATKTPGCIDEFESMGLGEFRSMPESYHVVSISEERWIFISAELSFYDPDSFIAFLNGYKTQLSGNIIEVSPDMRYAVTNDPFNLIFQWDGCFGISVVVPEETDMSTAEAAMRNVCATLNATSIKRYMGERNGD